MMNRKTSALLVMVGGVVLAVAASTPAAAQATPASLKCSAAKTKTLGKDASSKLGCWSKAGGAGAPVDPACIQKSSDKTTAGFGKAEAAGGCATEALTFGGSTTDLVNAVTALSADLADDLLIPTSPNKCAATKAKTAGKHAAALLGCHSKAIAKNVPLDPACYAKAEAKFIAAIDKADLKPPCLTTGDSAALNTKIKGYVEGLVPLMPRNDGCGSGFLNAPETCDDGNTANNDACPSDCIIDACNPLTGTDRPVTVSFASAKPVSALRILVDYPEGKVSIPGFGSDADNVISDIPNDIDGNPAFGAGNDLDHALREIVSAGNAIPAGQLLVVHFEDCDGATAPVVGDFTCTVIDTSDPALKPVKGVTCSVTP
jgi:cysteine-rich repeat protein